ncbi:MAG: hypothetical protein ACRYFK_07435 [Janthinobacterium lividum]
MKVFISWSGERSRRVAELLHTWIECVIQAVEPWVSSSDIDRGALWFTQIIDELSTTTHGIICLTRDNKEKPWILFEAGALAKGLNSSRIYTLLVDLNPEDVRDPLAQFNHTRPTESDMFKLVSSINRSLGDRGLKEAVLRKAFDTYWPQFSSEFEKLVTETEVDVKPKEERPQNDVLSEILNSVRGIDKRVRQIETKSNLSLSNNSLSSGPRIKSRTSLDASHVDAPRHPALKDIWEALKMNETDSEIIEYIQVRYPDFPQEEVRRLLSGFTDRPGSGI